MVKWICQILLLAAVMAFPVPLHTALGASEKKSTSSRISSQSLRVVGEVDFFAAIDLERIGMEAVKKAVEAHDWPAAKKALLAHMRSRKRPCFIIDRRGKNEYLAFVKNGFSQSLENLPAAADKVCKHDFTFEGSNHRFKGEVIWDRTQSGATFAYTIDDTPEKPNGVGHKITDVFQATVTVLLGENADPTLTHGYGVHNYGWPDPATSWGWLDDNRHGGVSNILFVDAHAASYVADDALDTEGSLVWFSLGD